MGLGLPGEIVSIRGAMAVIECWGTRRDIQLDSIADVVRVGDFVIEHEGAIVRRIAPEDVHNTMSLYEMVLAEA
ncbi:MAG: HypC/HybG/HupF family hydrogenase formation chaperone [Thermoanaerobaculia bacterium]